MVSNRKHLVQKNLRAEAMYKADTLAANMADAMIANDMRQLQSLLLNATNTPDMQAAYVYDGHGQPLLAWTTQAQLIKTSGIEATYDCAHTVANDVINRNVVLFENFENA